MADVLTGYTWDRGNSRYRDQSTGRYVSRDNIVKLLDDSVKSAEQRMNALGQAYQDGKIAPATYTVAMRDEVRRQHLQQAALARGGFDKLTQSDYGRAGQALRQLYPKIAGTSADVSAGEVSAAQLKQRHAAYAGSARAIYHRIEREQAGPSGDTKVVIEMRVLDPDAQHCEDCITYQGMGWQIAGTLPVPGEDSTCGHHCRCKIKRKEVNYWELDQWLGQESERDMTTAQELHQRLQEAHNCGEWMESRLHLGFTEIADNMFGDGLLTREERIALSSAIGAALTSFREQVQSAAAQLYKRGRWEEPKPGSDAEMEEAGEYASMFVPLVEQAVRRDGTIAMKLIQPGWGTTGYYPADVLERDGPAIFKAGTQMFWNHATMTEETERPEGDLNDLAAVLTSDARWQAQGPAGPGLYADAKVFEAYQKPINDLAPHIGVSIRAAGRANQGEAAGRAGRIINEITSAKSVDFVTKPGAGGQIIQMFEAARPGNRASGVEPATPEGKDKMSEQLTQQLTEAQSRLTQLETQNARLQEALLLRDARDYVATQLATSTLPDVTKVRLAELLATNPPVKDGVMDKATYAARIQEAVKAETEYLQKVAGLGSGRIVGMGHSDQNTQEFDETAVQKRLNESFARMGLSEKEAAIAANGRAY